MRDGAYWYGDEREPRDLRGIDVLEAFRTYRAAEAAMRRRTRQAMGMGENDLLVIRFLLRSGRDGALVSPRDLTAYLGVSTASTTALIDRLERSGHVRRVPNPADRRSVHVVATAHAHDEVRETLGEMHARMLEAVRGMTPKECRIVVACLTRLQDAVDRIEAPEVGRRVRS